MISFNKTISTGGGSHILGFDGDPDNVTAAAVDLSCTVGYNHKIALKAPVILPAMAKLNWRDYYAGAAMAGILVVIGESAIRHDPDIAYDEHGKVSHSPLIGEMIACFRNYERGYGDIVLQVNSDDVALGTPEYALQNFQLKTIEIKFGQAAKGIQHVAPVYDFSEALKIKKDGYLVIPDPDEKDVVEAVGRGEKVRFMQFGRLPMWDETKLSEMISRYRALGAENIFFKMAGYDIDDIKRVLRIASDNHVALVTFDGAGGGTGHSPCKMMNEWSQPTIELERIVHASMAELDNEGSWLPSIAMAAAVSGATVGKMIEDGAIPDRYKHYGQTSDAIFTDAETLHRIYKDKEEAIPTGSIGVYSYLQRVSWGLKLLMTLNRKFKLDLLDQSDVIPLTREARKYLDSLFL